MKISIIIPIYNVENEIQCCIQSVLQQDYSDIELVLVDDCSPDNSVKLAEELVKEYGAEKRTLLVTHHRNRGLSAARNSGIKASTGDYLFFLDSDDSLTHSNAISDLVKLIHDEETQYDVIIGNFQRVTSQGEILETGFQQDFCSSSPDEIYSEYVYGRLTVTAWGKLIRRSLLVENNLYFEEGIYHEDELWSFLFYRYVKRLRATSSIIYNYLERMGSISFSVKKKNVIDLNFVIERMYEVYLSERNSYHKKLIAIKIEKLRRRSLKWMAKFDSNFIEQQLVILKNIKISTNLFEIKYIEQFLLLNLPIRLVLPYLKFRWG